MAESTQEQPAVQKTGVMCLCLW